MIVRTLLMLRVGEGRVFPVPLETSVSHRFPGTVPTAPVIHVGRLWRDQFDLQVSQMHVLLLFWVILGTCTYIKKCRYDTSLDSRSPLT